jgi:hypothetical protein
VKKPYVRKEPFMPRRKKKEPEAKKPKGIP